MRLGLTRLRRRSRPVTGLARRIRLCFLTGSACNDKINEMDKEDYYFNSNSFCFSNLNLFKTALLEMPCIKNYYYCELCCVDKIVNWNNSLSCSLATLCISYFKNQMIWYLPMKGWLANNHYSRRDRGNYELRGRWWKESKKMMKNVNLGVNVNN